MRLTKFLFICAFTTSFSLLYVYQQTEVFRLAYVGQRKQAVLEDLLDKNSILRYNVGNSASLIRIGDRIASNPDFQIPDTYRLVRLAPSKEGLEVRVESASRETLLSRLFGIKRQAEAKTINP